MVGWTGVGEARWDLVSIGSSFSNCLAWSWSISISRCDWLVDMTSILLARVLILSSMDFILASKLANGSRGGWVEEDGADIIDES